jgi:hypothetical protein
MPRIGESSATSGGPTVGTVVRGQDPYWGGGAFIYLKNGLAIAANGAFVTWDKDFVASAVTNAANLGRPVAVAVGAVPIGYYAWFQVMGNAIVAATASVAAGVSIGITGVGTVGAFTAGKQIVGAVTAQPGTTTVLKTVETQNGSPTIKYVSSGAGTPGGLDGWFVGATMTGTGISGTILSIDQSNKTVTLSANASASGVVVATATYTGFLVVDLNMPNAQGQIT